MDPACLSPRAPAQPSSPLDTSGVSTAASIEPDVAPGNSQLDLDWDGSELKFLCRLVEVKGPGDRLMDRQVSYYLATGLH